VVTGIPCANLQLEGLWWTRTERRRPGRGFGERWSLVGEKGWSLVSEKNTLRWSLVCGKRHPFPVICAYNKRAASVTRAV